MRIVTSLSVLALAGSVSLQAVAQVVPTTGAARSTAPAAAAAPTALPATALPGLRGAVPAAPAPEPVARIAPVTSQAPATTTDVFGAQLFTGAFAREGATQFNPDYLVATGDTLQVRLWGAFDFDAQLVVDPQGNVFLPHVGPVPVRGVRNQELQAAMDTAVRRVFRANVSSYASLAAAQPVRVFVSGFVARPGLYSGTSMDSLLHYLDQAGGIDPDRGSFLDVQVQRNGQQRAAVNLYEFLLQGRMPALQLASGDVIFVPPRQNTVRVGGLAMNAKRFEFSGDSRSVADLMQLAKPQPSATHVRVVRNTGTVRNTEYYALQQAASVVVQDGDEIEFTADKKPGTITVRVEGEHQSPQEYVLPYGSRLGELLDRIEPNPRSDVANLQLYRQSVRQRQKEMLTTSLRSLETALLTARSGSSDEARLRKEEADLTLAWVDRAKQVEPLGQVLIAQTQDKSSMLLENGDVLRIPTKDDLVLVGGEVLFPNAVAFQSGLSLNDYIQRAGGFTQNADNARVVVARRDGSFEQVDTGKLLSFTPRLQAGDQVLVLPKVDEKNRQFWKDMTQIIYQIAVSAKVVLGL
ncbi:polysaccharide biosynthesis/export family protein [Ramlibacter rhizophilus]|uniref:Polysialic acid transporter n=1 Tax=Ramlibacter rhizophilus TaxID=1781167 RepID=A0A4Z0BPE4_9BURK|nr:polysaccharide biosynthesis/export family protein [Ramlibacter rhizophilus]TFY99924.1 polysialic acid transporter [Ramlibacter rhizophilus]